MHSLVSASRSSSFTRGATARASRNNSGHAMGANVICGGCLCGAVRYEAGGEPYNITHCHCADCRRSSGAPFVTWASFRRSHFRFSAGWPREQRWAGRFRSFCANCGTPLTFLDSQGSDEVDVTVCSFDDPAVVRPADHTWVEDRLPWIRLADDLPHHTRERQSVRDSRQPTTDNLET